MIRNDTSKNWFAVSAAVAVLCGCSHHAVHADPANTTAQKEGVISMWSSSVKDKGNQYDVSFNIKNLSSDHGIIVLLSDMTCKRGTVAGVLKHTFSSKGERAIDFKPGQTKSMSMVCRLPSGAAGDYVIEVAKVHDNASKDGKTIGPVLTSKLAWHYVVDGASLK